MAFRVYLKAAMWAFPKLGVPDWVLTIRESYYLGSIPCSRKPPCSSFSGLVIGDSCIHPQKVLRRSLCRV